VNVLLSSITVQLSILYYFIVLCKFIKLVYKSGILYI